MKPSKTELSVPSKFRDVRWGVVSLICLAVAAPLLQAGPGDSGLSGTQQPQSFSRVVDRRGGLQTDAVAVNLNFTSQLFPHVVDGGGEWQTELLLINNNSGPATVELRFHLDGVQQTLNVNGVGRVTDIPNITIPSKGSVLYTTVGNPAESLVSGWVEVISSLTLSGNALFRRHAAIDGKYYEASVPLATSLTTFTLPYDGGVYTTTGDSFLTGLAVANTGSSPTQITCSAYNQAGILIAQNLQLTTLSPSAHTALVLQGNPPFGTFIGTGRGVLTCSSSNLIGVLGLRFFGGAALSSLPVINGN